LKLEENNKWNKLTNQIQASNKKSNIKALKYHCGKEKFVIFFELEDEINIINSETLKSEEIKSDKNTKASDNNNSKRDNNKG
jgi:hypothetical protein